MIKYKNNYINKTLIKVKYILVLIEMYQNYFD